MTISVFAPMLNEIVFLPTWVECVTAFADQILLLDGGSTDGTWEMMEALRRREGRFECRRWPQEGRPYSRDWREGERRQWLLEQCRGDAVLWLDADEVVGDNFQEELAQAWANPANGWTLELISFWGDLRTQRLNGRGDPGKWHCQLQRVWRRGEACYTDADHHCLIRLRGGEWGPLAVRLFHLHYALGARMKPFDNRSQDMGIAWGQRGDPRFDLSSVRDRWGKDYRIETESYRGCLPRCLT